MYSQCNPLPGLRLHETPSELLLIIDLFLSGQNYCNGPGASGVVPLQSKRPFSALVAEALPGVNTLKCAARKKPPISEYILGCVARFGTVRNVLALWHDNVLLAASSTDKGEILVRRAKECNRSLHALPRALGRLVTGNCFVAKLK